APVTEPEDAEAQQPATARPAAPSRPGRRTVSAPVAHPLPEAPAAELTQQIRFCTAPDGTRIAYATVGSGPPLVKAANWMTHLDFAGESRVWHHWSRALARHHTLVRYDQRGCGLSDWDVDAFDLHSWVDDLELVVDALGLERFPLLGLSQGAAVAIAYAVRH